MRLLAAPFALLVLLLVSTPAGAVPLRPELDPVGGVEVQIEAHPVCYQGKCWMSVNGHVHGCSHLLPARVIWEGGPVLGLGEFGLDRSCGGESPGRIGGFGVHCVTLSAELFLIDLIAYDADSKTLCGIDEGAAPDLGVEICWGHDECDGSASSP